MFIRLVDNKITEILDGEVFNTQNYIEVPSNFTGFVNEDIRWFDCDFKRKPIEQLLQEGLIKFNKNMCYDPFSKDFKYLNDVEKILLGLEAIPHTMNIEEINGQITIKEKSIQQKYEENIISFQEYLFHCQNLFMDNKKDLLNEAYSYLFVQKNSFIKNFIIKKYIKKLINCTMDIRTLPNFNFPKKPFFIIKGDI